MTNIRNGQVVWPHCESCGCRLGYEKVSEGYILSHFYTHFGEDAQGHKCPKIGNLWIVSNNFMRAVE